jgi:signal peptidase I
MDFSAFLAIATVVTGVVWAVDALFFKPKRQRSVDRHTSVSDTNSGPKEPKIVEYARSFFPILLAVFILRSFIIEPFRIPSGSMKPTLLEGDFILVNKFVYGLRLPIFGTKLMNSQEPQRGDIFVFRYPKDTSIDFIKRVVGVPGDKISYKDKTIYVNGTPLSQEFVEAGVDVEGPGMNIPVKRFKEIVATHPAEKSHSIYLAPGEGAAMEEITVPEGMYFAMGDNRDNSGDSRSWGFVPRDLILGKAFFIWMSWDNIAKDVRWKRIGQKVY